MKTWTIIQTFPLPQDAYMAKAYLESAGLETLLQDEMIAQVYTIGANAFGGVKLLVRRKDVDEGIKILVEGGYLALENEKVDDDWIWVQKTEDITHCPFCKSEKMDKSKHINVVSVILYFILGIFSPLFRATYKCSDCNKAWKYKRGKVKDNNLSK